ncbi:MAG: hypothetical protein WD101_02545 [Gemmatimonadota bacterium]
MPNRLFQPVAPLRAALALVALVGASACGALGNSVPNPFDGSAQAGADQLRIQVQNMNFNDVTVYAVSAGQRIRLGNVTGKTDESFQIDWNFANPIAFQVDVIGGRGCETSAIAVDPGARVWLQIPSEMGMSGCRSGRA